MEVKMGLSITRAADEHTAAEFKFAKDHTIPHFQPKETDTMFILSAKLRGYRRENIKIDINRDGTIITIFGEKQVEEMVMVGWKVYKKGIETRKLRKAFRIPKGVILDNIKASFNEDEYMLNISMPKKVKGIVGIEIEEIKEEEEEEIIRQDKIPKRVTFKEHGLPNTGECSSQVNGIQSAADSQPEGNQDKKALEKDSAAADNPMAHDTDSPRQDGQELSTKSGKQEPESKQQKHEDQERVDQVHCRKGSGNKEEEQESALKKKSNMFAPLVAGSAMLLSLAAAFAIHVTRTKNQSIKRKD